MSTSIHLTKKASSSPKQRGRSVAFSVEPPVNGVSRVYAGFRLVNPSNAATEIIDLVNRHLTQHPAQSTAERLAAIKLMHEVKERLRILQPALTAAQLAEAGEHFARKAQSGFVLTSEVTPTAKPHQER